MAIGSVTSSVKLGVALAVASVGVWGSALAFRIGTELIDGGTLHPLPPHAAEELGLLHTQEPSPGGEICSLAVSPDGTLLAVGTRDGAVRLWETATQRLQARWQAHAAM